MKKRLHFIVLLIIFLWLITSSVRGQEIILEENFSGFLTGSHTSPSNSDASEVLDSKMSVPGWTGSKIYSAAGEIKIGTSTTTGWIETPLIDITTSEGNFTIKFDIARWVGDATTVQVYYNDIEKGEVISPADNFQTITVQCTGVTGPGKVKIKGLTKRFYLDNFFVIKDGVSTNIPDYTDNKSKVRLYPVPSSAEITLEGADNFKTIEILDINSRVISIIQPKGVYSIGVDISKLTNGFYFLRCTDSKKFEILRFVKTCK